MENRYSQTSKFLTPWKKFSDIEQPFFDSLLCCFKDTKDLVPATNIREADQYYLLSMDLPGIDEKDLHIQIDDGGNLSVSGKRYEETKGDDKGRGFTHLEKTYGEFHRSFQLSSHIDRENVQARYQNGVLEVLVPKIGTRSKIKVEANNGKSKEVFRKYLKN